MPDRSNVRFGFFVALLSVFVLLTALLFEPFLQYLLAAIMLAFVLRPLHLRLAARIDERLSAGLMVIVALAVGVLPVTLLVVTLPADAATLSTVAERLTTRAGIESLVEGVLGVQVPVASLLASLPERIAEFVIGDISDIVSVATHTFLGAILFLFVLYYLLKDGDRLYGWLRERTPLEPGVLDQLFDEAHDTTSAVLKGHVLVAVVQGGVAGLGLWVTGVPNVLFWTVVMTFLELFPVVGVAGVLGPAIVYLGLNGQMLAAGFLLAYGLTAVTLIDDYLRAYLVDLDSSLHSATILTGVFGGVYVLGLMGLFYGPILLGLSKTMFELLDDHYLEN